MLPYKLHALNSGTGNLARSRNHLERLSAQWERQVATHNEGVKRMLSKLYTFSCHVFLQLNEEMPWRLLLVIALCLAAAMSIFSARSESVPLQVISAVTTLVLGTFYRDLSWQRKNHKSATKLSHSRLQPRL